MGINTWTYKNEIFTEEMVGEYLGFVYMITNLESGNPLNYDRINESVNRYLDWYQCRNSLQPHEVNNKTYLDQIDTTNRIFELNCHDICTDKFVEQFCTIMEKSEVSDNFDLDYFAQFHPQYCNAQKNLQWFDSIHEWCQTGKLDDYLLSHSCIEACVIKRMFQELELAGVSIYNWRSKSTQEINQIYQELRSDQT